MKALIYGVGATGSRAGRQLLSKTEVEDLVLIDQRDDVLRQTIDSYGPPARGVSVASLRAETRLESFFDAVEGCDVAILTADDDQVAFAEAALRSGCHVVSTSDNVEVTEELAGLDNIAHEANKSLVIGAAFSPGLSCLLAKHASRKLDRVEEIHVARMGTGGPACARQHHRSLRSDALNMIDGEWVAERGGSGRELFWFPDPVGGLDCYQASLPEPLLLHDAFPSASRVTARLAATRRDRSTKWLPMLRRPHPEGLVGAIRVELRGTKDKKAETVVYGALDRPAVAAGTVASTAAIWVYKTAFRRSGAGSLGALVEDTPGMLRDLAVCGIRAAVFEGSASNTLH